MSKAAGTSGGLFKAYSSLYVELLGLGFAHDHVRAALTALPMVRVHKILPDLAWDEDWIRMNWTVKFLLLFVGYGDS
jgi:hypothetical protein